MRACVVDVPPDPYLQWSGISKEKVAHGFCEEAGKGIVHRGPHLKNDLVQWFSSCASLSTQVPQKGRHSDFLHSFKQKASLCNICIQRCQVRHCLKNIYCQHLAHRFLKVIFYLGKEQDLLLGRLGEPVKGRVWKATQRGLISAWERETYDGQRGKEGRRSEGTKSYMTRGWSPNFNKRTRFCAWISNGEYKLFVCKFLHFPQVISKFFCTHTDSRDSCCRCFQWKWRERAKFYAWINEVQNRESMVSPQWQWSPRSG